MLAAREDAAAKSDTLAEVKVLMPLPDRDFDVTEVAVPWRLLTDAGVEVVFATECGDVPRCDPLLIDGVLFGQLGAAPEPLAYYRDLEQTSAFREPTRWASLDVERFDGIVLPGGHAPGMKQYLGATVLHRALSDFWKLERPVGAICHGVLPLARAQAADTGRSLLFDRATTCLPKYMERLAYGMTFWKLGRYYRTYIDYVEDEVRAALRHPEQFHRGPLTLGARGTRTDHRPAFVVENGRYVSARWPGDAYLFAERFIDRLRSSNQPAVAPR